jgi:hypothetical protein
MVVGFVEYGIVLASDLACLYLTIQDVNNHVSKRFPQAKVLSNVVVRRRVSQG